MTDAEQWRDRVQREMGRTESALKAHEDRMDRQDDAVKELVISVNNRFDGMKLHLDRQDEKLDILIQRNARTDGADGARKDAKKAWMDRSGLFWSAIVGICTAIGVTVDVSGRWIFAVLHGGHP